VLDLQTFAADRRDTCVVRADAAGVVELHPRHLYAVFEHLDEPRIADRPAGAAPPVRVLVVLRRRKRGPRVLNGSIGAVVDEFQGHGITLISTVDE
jgi:hypothetical protein